jgi:integrase
VRTADVRNAKHADIDPAAAAWTIPEFSKIGGEFRVPLSTAALAVFDKARRMAEEIGGKVSRSEFAFPNDVTGAGLSRNAMLGVLERMGRKGAVTTHGYRSSFRTWCLEQTNFPWELAEISLGHKVGSKVERAYQRGDGFRKRAMIMQAWSNFCDRPVDGSTVISIGRSRR